MFLEQTCPPQTIVSPGTILDLKYRELIESSAAGIRRIDPICNNRKRRRRFPNSATGRPISKSLLYAFFFGPYDFLFLSSPLRTRPFCRWKLSVNPFSFSFLLDWALGLPLVVTPVKCTVSLSVNTSIQYLFISNTSILKTPLFAENINKFTYIFNACKVFKGFKHILMWL